MVSNSSFTTPGDGAGLVDGRDICVGTMKKKSPGSQEASACSLLRVFQFLIYNIYIFIYIIYIYIIAIIICNYLVINDPPLRCNRRVKTQLFLDEKGMRKSTVVPRNALRLRSPW